MKPSRSGVFLFLLFFSEMLLAVPKFPELSGRVVDQAKVLSAGARSQLESTLKSHESSSSNQIVVVTLKSLQGYDISDLGYQLARHWEIGQKGRNNGVLLIIAPEERKVRIEVGYGLEGNLTDALSHNIIQTQILPKFRQGGYDSGAEAGVEAIIQAIDGTYEPIVREESPMGPLMMFLLIWVVFYLMTRHSERVYNNHPGRYGSRRGRSGRSGGFGGGFGGGGFGGGGFGGGGGGGFGGGGAYGGW